MGVVGLALIGLAIAWEFGKVIAVGNGFYRNEVYDGNCCWYSIDYVCA
jgi:hypothetical protein